jgi:hypothetical protein
MRRQDDLVKFLRCFKNLARFICRNNEHAFPAQNKTTQGLVD